MPARPPPPFPAEPPAPTARIELPQLPGWAGEDHAAALAAWRQTCGVARDAALRALCARAQKVQPPGARSFLEVNFQAEPPPPPGLLTAYFAPVYPARAGRTAEFSAPLRPKPADLVPDAPYAERAAIEARPPTDALAWMRPEELFLLQVQGSGVVVFDDGRRRKALFAAHNGRPYVAIAGPMRERGLLPREGTSSEAIRAWLAAHRGPAADALMRLNPRYVFFTLSRDDGRAPPGAAGAPLPAGRAVAIDPAHHGYGGLLWLDADRPRLKGARPAYRRLAVALDTGGAIKGPARADLYLGEGPAAGAEAGLVAHALRLYRLVPR
jgi:membrane-bound lytic murein transglycosylase A